MKLYRYIILWSLLFGYGIIASAQPCNNIIKGYILDQHDLSALSYASVVVSGTSLGAEADSLGFFEIKGLCKGSYTLICSHVGCEPVKRKVEVVEAVTNLNFYPEHHAHELKQIFIRARTNQEITNVRNSLNAEQLRLMKSDGLTQTLATIPGLSVLSTGSNIEKPTIHGLYGSRIAIIQQGSRLEDQQWGSDHAPNIDVRLFDKVEVIKGAASVRFGAKAMGGAILLEQKPVYTGRQLKQEVLLSAESNSAGIAVSSVIQRGDTATHTGWKMAAGIKKYGDRSAPDFVLSNTGTTVADLGFSFGYHKGEKRHRITLSGYYNNAGLLAASQVNSQDDILRALEADKPLVIHPFSFGIEAPRQSAVHTNLLYNGQISLSKDHKLKLNVSYQYDNRREYDVRRGGRSNIPAVNMNLHTAQLELLEDHRWNDIFSGMVGLNILGQINVNNPNTQRRPIIPYYNLFNPGIFAYQQANLNHLTIEAGIRVDYQHLNALYYDLNQKLHEPRRNFGNVVFNIGISADILPEMRFKANTGLAYRAPDVNELYSNGVHLSSVAYEVGDPDLRSERLWKTIVELSNSKDSRLHYSIDMYFQLFRNYIYQRPNGFVSAIAGIKLRYDYVQTDAVFGGFDALMKYRILPWWQIEGKASGLRATNRATGLGIPLIPPLHISGESMFTLWKNKKNQTSLRAGINVSHFSEQKRYNPADLFAGPPPGYTLAGALIRYSGKNERNTLELKVTNLFNTRYSSYLNNLRYFAPQEVGRNWILQYRFGINQ